MRGLVFTLDILLSLTLVIILVFSSYYVFTPEPIYRQMTFDQQKLLADDFLEALAEAKVEETFDSPTLNALKATELGPDDLEVSVLDLVLTYRTIGMQSTPINETKINLSRNISLELINASSVLRGYNSNLSIEAESGFGGYSGINDSISVSSLIENTYGSKATYGYMSRAYIDEITSYRSKYVYFGGFIGQGDIKLNVEIPSSAIDITSAYLEVNSGSNFSVWVNGGLATIFEINTSAGNFSSNAKGSVNSSGFTPGNNTVTITFQSTNLSKQYLGGGFLRVNYISNEFYDEGIAGTAVYHFPQIDGIPNIYDSFFVPGNLSSLSLKLHYKNNVSGARVFLNIANATIYDSNTSGEVDLTFDNATLGPLVYDAGMSYQGLSSDTVPVRLGMRSVNITTMDVGNADVILLTDLSGSMNWTMGADNVTGINRTCDDVNLTENTTSRIALARCLDKEFVNIIMNSTGNRIAVVGFYGDVGGPEKGRTLNTSLTSNKTLLNNAIGNYSPQGGTCVCCGINKAYEILNTQSNSTRKKYIVVMSDGVPTHDCDPGVFNTGDNPFVRCRGTDLIGTPNGVAGCFGDRPEDCVGVNCICASYNANWSSWRAHNYTNATVDTIGFGLVTTCTNANETLTAMAGSGNGTYYAGANGTTLFEIYSNLADAIVGVSYTTQTVEIEGSVVLSGNFLYNDSRIDIGYVQTPVTYGFGEFSFVIEKNCTDGYCLLNKPSGVDVLDAKVTSYSGDYWAALLKINGTTAYNLSEYGHYSRLGDPYTINIPPANFSNGINNVSVFISLNGTGFFNASNDSKLIYSIKVPGYVGYGGDSYIFDSSEEARINATQRLIDYIEGLTGEVIPASSITTVTALEGIKSLSQVTLVKFVLW